MENDITRICTYNKINYFKNMKEKFSILIILTQDIPTYMFD